MLSSTLTIHRPDVAQALATAGVAVTEEMYEVSERVFADELQARPHDDVDVARDLAYGPHPRHRADVFVPRVDGGPRPVLAFVHGGGYVYGDKSAPGSPYFDNVGLWAARNGFVGVTAAHRLAPEHPWPAGGDDVARLAAWLADAMPAYGGDPDAVLLAGHSSGATHVAAAVTTSGRGAPSGVRGLVLLSGIVRLAEFGDRAMTAPYLPEGVPQPPIVERLAASGLPVLLVVAEHDPPEFHDESRIVFDALSQSARVRPAHAQIPDHNHITLVTAIGTTDDLLGQHIRRFARSCLLAPGSSNRDEGAAADGR